MSSISAVDPQSFYLGRLLASAGRLELPSRHLTTHAVVVGMTGSGKTGMSIGLLEEAALSGVPVLAIDPKGDLCNLALRFPSLAPEAFEPWLDPEDARRAGLSMEDQAKAVASRWQAGLRDSGQGSERLQRLVDTNEVRIYTPGSRAGVPLAMLRGLTPPKMDDEDAFREHVVSTASSLLGVVGIEGAGMQSREFVLVSRLLHDAWSEGHTVDLEWLVGAVQRPPFERIGALDVDVFYPVAARTTLAMQLNNLLADPSTQIWMEGEPLDIQQMFFGADGRARTVVISIAHLGDRERMFVVTSLLAGLIGWMRAQPGTSGLRALLFMDEVFGFLPPVANPPSKLPMLTLLKQARAFGLGVVLATQNPVDLDYKALANCGTWFLGRLQTERDRARVLDGLEGAAAGFDRVSIDQTLSGLRPRQFLMHSVHSSGPVVFESRWTMSYLRGPVTREEIKRLRSVSPPPAAIVVRPVFHPSGVADVQPLPSPPTPRAAGLNPPTARRSLSDAFEARRAPAAVARPESAEPSPVAAAQPVASKVAASPATSAPSLRPVQPRDTDERFLGVGRLTATAYVIARLHYVDKAHSVDAWEDVALAAPLVDDDRQVDWSSAVSIDPASVERSPPVGASWAPVPSWLATEGAKRWSKQFIGWSCQGRSASVLYSPSADVASQLGESEAAFRARLVSAVAPARDAALEAVRGRYATRIATHEGRVRKAAAKEDKEKVNAAAANVDTMATWGGAILGAMLGKGSVVSKVTSAARTTNRNLARQSGADAAKRALEEAESALALLIQSMEADLATVAADYNPATLRCDRVDVRPRKSEIQVLSVAVLWCALP